MKTKMLSLVVLMVLSTFTVFANAGNTEKFKVAGNCGMCETRIEKAAKSVDGVSSADWDKETKMIKVTFDSKKTDIHKIHIAIAKAGHDTKMHSASDEVYNSLPACCKYERMSKEKAKS
ncbi:MAG: heavy-metal-associated domain-containing protein [Bacteroidales bacterium]|jgi:mercuric ion binding protein|nr:heavy-metal-associated domain-containing protein [Bacteroidales bacterium]